jgi:hypothetical protein
MREKKKPNFHRRRREYPFPPHDRAWIKKYASLDHDHIDPFRRKGSFRSKTSANASAFRASQLGLYYTPETIRALFASMGTGKIIILEGISGTGKTSLPYALGRFFQNPAVICSVQPSWRDRAELLGYLQRIHPQIHRDRFLTGRL